VLAQYNAITNKTFGVTDDNGHGSHINSLILSSYRAAGAGLWNGIAPDANLVSIKAFDYQGRGYYADVIRAIDWAVTNKNNYNIRVLNMSFSAPPQSYYWEDPLNQAVMRAWQVGIVVVSASGNTAGRPSAFQARALCGYRQGDANNQSPFNSADDYLTQFSSAGPTLEGFVKPDVIAPGHSYGLMSPSAYLPDLSQSYLSGCVL
jgi:serine protease AprX